MKKFLLIIALSFFVLHISFAQTGTKGVTVTNTAPATATGKTWAVIVGISEYQNISKLSYAHKDAEAFYKYLRTPQVNVPSENIKMLLNKEALSSEIYGTLEWLTESVKENDKVIFYFSGHGDVEKKTVHQNGFLLAYDSPTAAYMTKGTISIKFLQDYLETYVAVNKAKEVLLIVDACKSGKLAGGMEGIQMTMQALGKQWSGQITKILSAQEGELSLEDPKWGGGRGVFSYYLMKGIQGLANRNADNVITTAELAAYLPIAVADETANTQNPKIEGEAKHSLFTFDGVLLADAKKDDLMKGQMLAVNTTKKGIADNLSPEIADAYSKYTELVKKGWLLWGATEKDTINCALHVYNQLLNNPAAVAIRPSLKSSFLTALQKKSQSKLDDYIKGVPDLFAKKDLRTVKEIMFAGTIVDKNHILYNYINARALFFNSLLVDDDLAAIKLLKSALKLEDDAAYILNRIGLRYANANLSDSAIYYYEKAKEFAPAWTFPYNNLGIQYTASNTYDKAITNAEKGLELDPKFAGLYNVLGTTYEAMEDYEKAIPLYEKAIALDSTQALFYSNISNVYIEKKLYPLAIQAAQKAIDLDPNYSDAINNIGRVYLISENYEQAEKYFKKAIEITPTEGIYLENLANLLYNSKRYDEALTLYKKIITLYVNYNDAWVSISDTYNALDKKAEGLDYFKDYIKNNHTSSYPYIQLAKYYDENSDKKTALFYYNEALRYNLNLGNAYANFAQLHIDLGNLVKGYAYGLKGAELNVNRCYFQVKSGIYKMPTLLLEAYKLYTDSLLPREGDGRFYTLLGDLFLENKNYQKALYFYEKAISLDQSSPLSRYYSASIAAMQLKDYKKSIQYATKVSEEHSTNFNAYYVLASVYSLTNDIPNSLKNFKLALENGFDYHGRIMADENLINLRKTSKFKELMKIHFPDN
ncbi:tetratricopeptide repeat protein [Pedobacter sp. LMG 31464]|uniref:Tetratricopeptide repeat protein n=1 Tax=Pedobacter planticolens TaxID=2679964 RepID=A0A923DWD6_9SPHI|nr:tetratricopeptide repeat protein [Pedobacter planticolens]MBB2144310.1 tetratricopeptide repeat protein [Pedobacter planticolens]